MSSSSNWFDPICYQLFFYALSREKYLPDINNAHKQFIIDFLPFFEYWLSVNGRLMVYSENEVAHPYFEFNDIISFRNYCYSLCRQHSYTAHKLSPIPDNTLSKFAIPLNQIDKTWKEQTKLHTEINHVKQIDLDEQLAWLCKMMNCYTNDLNDICFPRSSFSSKEIPLSIDYHCWNKTESVAYKNEILLESGLLQSANVENSPYYVHRLHISLPRFILKKLQLPFAFQEKWKGDIKKLSQCVEYSVGWLKMDRCCFNEHPLLTGNGSFLLGFTHFVPDVSWGMSLRKEQINLLGGIENLCDSKLFDTIEQLNDHHVYLQLTPNISLVSKSKAKSMWQLFYPHLQITKLNCHFFGDVPPSFRLGIERNHLHITEYDSLSYRITNFK